MTAKAKSTATIAGLAVAAAVGCGGGNSDAPPDQPVSSTDTFGINIVAGGQSFKLGPVSLTATAVDPALLGPSAAVPAVPDIFAAFASATAGASGSDAGTNGAALRTNDVTVIQADGGLTSVADSADVTQVNGWALVAGAAYECGWPSTYRGNVGGGPTTGPARSWMEREDHRHSRTSVESLREVS